MARIRAVSAVACAIALLTLAACGDDGDASSATKEDEVTRVRYGYVPTIASLPVYVAKSTGLFEKHGLDVELVPTQQIASLAPGLGRQYDVIQATPYDFLTAAARGIDPVAVSGLVVVTETHPGVDIFASKDVKSPADLAGKTMGVPQVAGPSAMTTRHWLSENGIDPESVKLIEVPFPNMADQLGAGQVDAVFSVQPFSAQMAQQGFTLLGDPFLAVGPPSVLGAFTAAKRSWADENADTADEFNRAVTEAVDRIVSDETEARRVLQETLKLPAPAAKAIPLPEWQAQITAADFGDWIDVMNTAGAFDGTKAPNPDLLVR